MQTDKILSLAILISLILCWPRSLCKAQKKIPPTDYDYYALAITSIAEITADATKLPDPPQRVKVLIEAAKILQPAKKEEAVRVLELVLRDLKEWGSTESATWRQRNTAATLRNEALAVYALVDSEQAAKVALSLIDTEPDRALGLVVQSLQGGTVSGVIFDIVQRLIQNGNRALLDRLENRIAQVLATNISLDPYSLSSASTVGLVDKDMPQAAKSAFVSFLMRSLQAWAMVVKEPGTDSFYVTRGSSAFSGNIRYLILQYAPDQLLEFDLLLDQTTPSVPERMRSIVQRLEPETFSDPKDRLENILKDAVTDRRDLRLNRFVSELLRNESDDSEKRFDLAADAINGFTDPDAKSAYTDLLTITRVNALVKQKKMIEAQQRAGSLSSEEMRAWALLAVATEAAKEDSVLGFESISKALKALDAASPSPYKTELALLAAAMLVKDDSRRAFETLVAASKYANSSKDTSRTKPPFAFGLEAKMGEIDTRLGVVPLNLSEVRIDPKLAALATTDWFRADQIVSDIREPSLRLLLRLEFAGAVLAKELKSRKAKPLRSGALQIDCELNRFSDAR